MKTEEVRMRHFFTWCHNEKPMTLMPADAELPLIDGCWGSEGYLVAIDTSADDDETKFSKLRLLVTGLNGYGVNFSFLLLRFGGGRSFFYPAVVMYMKRKKEPDIEHFTTLEYYARKAMDYGNEYFERNYTLLKCEKGKPAMLTSIESEKCIGNGSASETIRRACELLSRQNEAQFEGYALAPSPTHNMERLPRHLQGEIYETYDK